MVQSLTFHSKRTSRKFLKVINSSHKQKKNMAQISLIRNLIISGKLFHFQSYMPPKHFLQKNQNTSELINIKHVFALKSNKLIKKLNFSYLYFISNPRKYFNYKNLHTCNKYIFYTWNIEFLINI